VKTNIFIPEKINVGFQNRNDTYTKKLAYIIYFDQKGILRKETSWQGWRDEKIPNQILENVPTSGFVLNKKVGGYNTGWNHRQTYCRVYDPRDFEFEITIPNLLFILENATSTKGKGLEGDFVYGWDGKDLILIPTESPDYKELSEFNEKLHQKTSFQGKDMILGGTYKFKNNTNKIYMGKFQKSNGEDKEVNEYFFHETSDYEDDYFSSYKSLSGQIIDAVDKNCVENYAELMDKLNAKKYISQRDQKKDKYIDYTLDKFKKHAEECYYNGHFYNENGDKFFISKYREYWYGSRNTIPKYDVSNSDRNRSGDTLDREMAIERVYEKYKPCYLATYKSNGEIIKEWRRVKDEKCK